MTRWLPALLGAGLGLLAWALLVWQTGLLGQTGLVRPPELPSPLSGLLWVLLVWVLGGALGGSRAGRNPRPIQGWAWAYRPLDAGLNWLFWLVVLGYVWNHWLGAWVARFEAQNESRTVPVIIANGDTLSWWLTALALLAALWGVGALLLWAGGREE